MKNQLPDIVKKSESLLLEIERAVRSFPRYHKYTLGSDMRNQAMSLVRLGNGTCGLSSAENREAK